MKLAEALVERKAAQAKIGELNERIQRSALVQEGLTPPEDPAALLSELAEVSNRLESLIVAINRSNLQATLPDGQTVTAAIARRDVLRMRTGVIDALIRTLGTQNNRARGTEIRMIPTMELAQLQRGRDLLAKEYRELDTAIQSVNWTTELTE